MDTIFSDPSYVKILAVLIAVLIWKIIDWISF